jgi:hypothetical protein
VPALEMPVPSQGHYGFPSFPVVEQSLSARAKIDICAKEDISVIQHFVHSILKISQPHEDLLLLSFKSVCKILHKYRFSRVLRVIALHCAFILLLLQVLQTAGDYSCLLNLKTNFIGE